MLSTPNPPSKPQEYPARLTNTQIPKKKCMNTYLTLIQYFVNSLEILLRPIQLKRIFDYGDFLG